MRHPFDTELALPPIIQAPPPLGAVALAVVGAWYGLKHEINEKVNQAIGTDEKWVVVSVPRLLMPFINEIRNLQRAILDLGYHCSIQEIMSLGEAVAIEMCIAWK